MSFHKNCRCTTVLVDKYQNLHRQNDTYRGVDDVFTMTTLCPAAGVEGPSQPVTR